LYAGRAELDAVEAADVDDNVLGVVALDAPNAWTPQVGQERAACYADPTVVIRTSICIEERRCDHPRRVRPRQRSRNPHATVAQPIVGHRHRRRARGSVSTVAVLRQRPSKRDPNRQRL